MYSFRNKKKQLLCHSTEEITSDRHQKSASFQLKKYSKKISQNKLNNNKSCIYFYSFSLGIEYVTKVVAQESSIVCVRRQLLAECDSVTRILRCHNMRSSKLQILNQFFVFYFPCRFICQQSRMDNIKIGARIAIGHRRLIEFWQICACTSLLDRIIHGRRITRGRSLQKGDFHRQSKLFIINSR